MLPGEVQRVRAKGRDYYYWAPNRNTSYAGKRVPLGRDPTDPEFWRKIEFLRSKGGGEPEVRPGSFAALIRAYVSSPEWQILRPRTHEVYQISLDRIQERWGDLPVQGTTARDIYRLRDEFSATPVAANHLVSVLRGLLTWGIPRGYCERNAASDVLAIGILDQEITRPWPESAWKIVVAEGPEHLRRAAILGRACGQRRSDLVKFGRRHRRDDGLEIKIGKLRDKRHFIPLRQSEIVEIDSWSCSDTGPWIVSPRGKAMSGDHLAASLGRFVADHDELRAQEGLTPHGWRAMAVCDRRIDGLTHQEIAAQLGMSLPMVMRYSKHIDQELLARRGNARREQKSNSLKNSASGD